MAKKLAIAGGVLCGVLMIALFCIFAFSENSNVYYARVESEPYIQQSSPLKMLGLWDRTPTYSYRLEAVSELGLVRRVTFQSSRELPRGTLLRMTILPLRGVVEWEAVRYQDLPPMAQNRIPAQ